MVRFHCNDSLRNLIFPLAVFLIAGLACNTDRTVSTPPNSYSYFTRVQDIDGIPIKNAKIIMELMGGNNGSVAPVITTTNEEGYARFILGKEFIGKPIRIRVTAIGYEEFKQDYDLISTLPQEIQLKKTNTTSAANIPSTPRSSTPKIPPTISSTESSGSKTPVLVQEYNGILIELTASKIVGTSITINFKLTNKNLIDKNFFLGGGLGNGGYEKFFGAYSSMFAEGNWYVAQEAYLAGNGGINASLTIPGNQYVTASLKFNNVPSSLQTIDRLNLCVSTEGRYPNNKLPFEYITITH